MRKKKRTPQERGRLNLVNALLISFLSLTLVNSSAQTFPPNFASQFVVGGINYSVAMAFSPDGRIFITEQRGRVLVVKDGVLLPEPFVEVETDLYLERGLQGIAFDPHFEHNQYVYIYYTVPGEPAHNRVSRFTANGDVAVEGSEKIILELDDLSDGGIHNGGALHFDNSGKLLIATGDGGYFWVADDLDSYLGKILRVNPDGSVPEGNPYSAEQGEKAQRIWVTGLRNPYTFWIQPGTGRIFVNDVGQSLWEEVNDATVPGKFFGWPGTEGPTTAPGVTAPLYAYPHGAGTDAGCAIVGGAFFNPPVTNYPAEYYGKYFFMDLCNGYISTLDDSGGELVREVFATNIVEPIALTLGPDGYLYYFLRSSNGSLQRIIYNATTEPYIVNHPKNVLTTIGQPINLSVGAMGTGPFTYQWQKDDVDIDGATESTFSIASAAEEDAGSYKVIVSNVDGSATSNAAIVVVLPNPPVAKILLPSPVLTYTAGAAIDFAGVGVDVEDGLLPAENFVWSVDFHHDTHKHDQPGIEGVQFGTFHIADHGETSDNVWYRIILTVTDSDGLTGKDSVDIYPRKSKFTLVTDPPGLTLTLDGAPITTPVTITGVEGILRTLGALSPQPYSGSKSLEFDSWSQGGDIIQSIATPTDDMTYTAKFISKKPVIVTGPADTAVYEGDQLHLGAVVLGEQPLTYRWQKFGKDIEGHTDATYSTDSTLLKYSGQYRLIVTNSFGSDTSAVAFVSVVPNAPMAQILNPAPDSTFAAGTLLKFSGIANDLEEGVLPASSLSWKIYGLGVYRTELLATASGSTGTFYIPDSIARLDNAKYRIILTAKDSRGFSSKDSVDILPRKSTINLQTDPAGFNVLFDGLSVKTPATVTSSEGFRHILGVIKTQGPMGDPGVIFRFRSWQNGTVEDQVFRTPEDDMTFIASFLSRRPYAQILKPTGDSTYVAGTQLKLSGIAADFEEGVLPAQSLNWKVYAIGDDTRELMSDGNGYTLTFDIPDTSARLDGVEYRAVLVATDSRGLRGRDSLNLVPRKSTINLETDPSGLEVLLDGHSMTTPASVSSTEGFRHTLGVDRSQGPLQDTHVTFEFKSWEDESTNDREFTTPENDVTFKASFFIILGAGESAGTNAYRAQLYPNPVRSGKVTLNVISPREQSALIYVSDLLSRRVITVDGHFNEGTNSVSVDIDELAGGLYTVLVKTAEETHMLKMLVVK